MNDRSKLVRLDWCGTPPDVGHSKLGAVLLRQGTDGRVVEATDFLGRTHRPHDDRASGLAALDGLYGLDVVCVPDHVHPRLPAADRAAITAGVVALCERRRDCIALLATPCAEHETERFAVPDTRFAAVYYPWLRSPAGTPVPAIGHVAGAYACSDAQRGIHWAPLGVVLDAALEHGTDARQRDLLERRGVNVLTTDPESGRTTIVTANTAAIDDQYRYLTVIRLAAFIRRRILEGLNWLFFERGTPAVWQRVEGEVRAFLTLLWEDGVLAGKRPEEAFFIRCDETTMTADDIAAGRIGLLVGVTPSIPTQISVEMPPLHAAPPIATAETLDTGTEKAKEPA